MKPGFLATLGKRLQKAASLPMRKWLLLAEAGCWVVGVRLGLWLLPLRKLQRRLRWIKPPTYRQELSASTVRDLVWAVQSVSRYVPAASCLTQALAARTMLFRRGYAVELRIGVAKKQQLEAHAWLEWQGSVIIGGIKDLERYLVLPIESYL